VTIPPLGVIEGYYGLPWTWDARAAQVSFLKPHGYNFYMYAPKADPYLRRRWREPHPEAEAQAIGRFAAHCKATGVRFGVGLSPYELYRDFNPEAQKALAEKLKQLDAMGVQDLGVLFDDMRGDLPGLAETQMRIVDWIAARTGASRIVLCPTYYSDDPVLDRVFGERPRAYLEDLGKGLDPAIELFWTGEEVCSKEYGPGHLARVAEMLRRKLFLWDNYPVNDGPRMSPYLHIRAFTGRPAAMGEHLSAHAINPALQPVLTRIPALTLAESYRLGDAYQYGEAFGRAAEAVLGRDLGALVHRHLGLLNDTGLDNLGEAAQRLRDRYVALDHPAAGEIVDWLDGRWRITAEMVEAS
jgi:hypothetical protein